MKDEVPDCNVKLRKIIVLNTKGNIQSNSNLKNKNFATFRNQILTKEEIYLFKPTMHSTAVISSNILPFEFQNIGK